jgi:hypothetical protein
VGTADNASANATGTAIDHRWMKVIIGIWTLLPRKLPPRLPVTPPEDQLSSFQGPTQAGRLNGEPIR